MSEVRLIDADKLKEELKKYFSDGTLDSVSAKLAFNMILRKIDEAPTAKTYCYFCGQTEHGKIEERPQGECKSCRHRDPEDKKCDCGGLERQGCPFPVNDDYYCKYYEKGGAE